jgi:hypothetical protein
VSSAFPGNIASDLSITTTTVIQRQVGFSMCKKSLQEAVVSEVAEAQAWASALTALETRGPGDTDNAMRRVSRRHGIEYGSLWSLRYRTPKRIWADTYNRLRAAYVAECERQMQALHHEIEITRAAAGSDHPAVRKAEALVREAGE